MHTVEVIIEAKLEKESDLKKALMKVMEISRLEKACIDYRLHQNSDNPAQFILYEIWESKEAHQAQFQKPYIIELAEQLDLMLAIPYQVIFAQQL